MPTQLDNTWLPPETRIGGDGNVKGGPFDYGSGEYYSPRTDSKVFNGKDFDTIIANYHGYEYSTNIRAIIEHYEVWAKQNIKELQKITDGKNNITIDDLLWYLRYEKQENISRILGENIVHYHGPIIRLPSKFRPLVEAGHISHSLMHTIKKSIDELATKK